MYTTKHFWNINMEIINQEIEDTKNKTEILELKKMITKIKVVEKNFSTLQI